MIGAYIVAGLGCFAVGGLVGATSIGGFLLVPILMVSLDLPISQAVANTLVSYIPTGLIAINLYYRDRRIHVPMGLGLGLTTLPGIWTGLWLSRWMSERAAEVTLSCLLVVLSVYVGRQAWMAYQQRKHGPAGETTAATSETEQTDHPAWQTRRGWLILIAASLVAGMAASLAGVGGALILVPLMVSLGVVPGVAVGTGILFSTVSAVIASIGKMADTPIDVGILTLVVVTSTAGILIGESTARRLDARALRGAIAALCFFSAIAVLL